MYREKQVKNSEALQLILLDNLYAQSGSEKIIFQGGTALRWVYGGMRFSEDLDKESVSSIIGAIQNDLPRFIPQNIFSLYQEQGFSELIKTLQEVISDLLDQGMKKYFENHETRESSH